MGGFNNMPSCDVHGCRPRDDGEGSSQKPSARRRRLDTSSTHVPPPIDAGSHVPPSDGIDPFHEEADAVEALVAYLGGPSDLSLLTRYADYTARHVRDEEFYNHDRKITALQQPDESWFPDVLTDSGLKDLCQIGYSTIYNGMLVAFAERWHHETSSFH
ncbi:uncharacterized protein LOC131644347 [Vicia villosa]|uniref:uncharacterized protein LOC131644347 n=1 Tax=Vicia villosa TaxID=3911 RepID=UPI00273AAD20|nr:uncharacterized protein LOC131644347 [Vicia villosa]